MENSDHEIDELLMDLHRMIFNFAIDGPNVVVNKLCLEDEEPESFQLQHLLE
jgi:hypothetical protein